MDWIAIYNFAYLSQRIRSQKLIDVNGLTSRETRLAITQETQHYLLAYAALQPASRNSSA